MPVCSTLETALKPHPSINLLTSSCWRIVWLQQFWFLRFFRLGIKFEYVSNVHIHIIVHRNGMNSSMGVFPRSAFQINLFFISKPFRSFWRNFPSFPDFLVRLARLFEDSVTKISKRSSEAMQLLQFFDACALALPCRWLPRLDPESLTQHLCRHNQLQSFEASTFEGAFTS